MTRAGRLNLLIIGLVVSSLAVGAQSSYPSWFLDPPPGASAAIFAKTEKEAVEYGGAVLATYAKARVIGDFQVFFDSSIDQDSFNNTEYYYYPDSAEVKRLAGAIKTYDSSIVSLMPPARLWLVGTKDSALEPDRSLVAASDLPKPAWSTKTGYVEGDRIYGVGRFTFEADAAHAWVKAEEIAVFNLLTANSVMIGESTTQSVSSGAGDSTLKIQWIRLRYELSDLRVEHRWINADQSLCLVLVSSPKSSIRSLK